MSVPNQPNGKKSSNSSIANTPASTPIANSNGNAQALIHSSPPPNNNAPKYGTLVPNRIFVGGISANTTEGELLQLFSTYGTVKAAKIIQDRAGVSKGYGFITFESEDDAQRPLREADNIVLRERKLNIAPAVKKQISFPQPFNFNRAFEGSGNTTVTVGNPQYFLPPGMTYYQGGMSYYPPPPSAPVPGDPNAQQPVYQAPAVYPAQTGPPQAATYPSMMFPAAPIYMPQQYPMAMPYEYSYYTNNGAPAQYMVGAQGGPGAQGPPLPPSGSPPRPPCYNQQVSYPSEPVYYNVPVYSGPMEHPPVYSEPMEAAGNFEFNMEQMPPLVRAIELDYKFNSRQPVYRESAAAQAADSSLTHNHAPPNDARYSNNTTPHPDQQPPQQQQQREMEGEAARQTNTPVVSLLSIDNSVEKDLNAMQGGRKKKPLPAPTPVANGLPQMSFPPPNFPPPPITYPQQHFNVPIHPFGHQHPFNGFDYARHAPPRHALTNGYAKKQQKRNYNNNNNNNNYYNHHRQNEISNRSSLRTESSSSTASCVDDSRNSQMQHRTGVNTPPPAPYSPLTNHGYTSSHMNGVLNPPNVTYNNNNSRPRNYHNNNNNNYQDKRRPSNNKAKANGGFRPGNARDSLNQMTNNRVEGNAVNTSHEQNAPQVHNGAASGYGQMSSSNGTRRNRRSTRRSNTATSGALSEIGAGDAPLPAQSPDSVAEACKKLDSLKL